MSRHSSLVYSCDSLHDSLVTAYLGVQPPPHGPVLRVVLGGVEVGVHLVLAELPEQVQSLVLGPWSVVEPLDDPREEGGLGLGLPVAIHRYSAHGNSNSLNPLLNPLSLKSFL